MCALCGVLGIEHHWTAATGGDAPGIDPAVRRADRLKRIAAANQLLGLASLTLRDWQGTAYVLSTPTGASHLVDNLGELWPLVESLTGRRLDPLLPDVIESLW